MTRESKAEGHYTVTRPRMLLWIVAISAAATMSLPAVAADKESAEPDGEHGAALYEEHCVSCHDSLMHLQGDRRTGTYAAVTEKVRFWSDLQRLQWTEQEIDDVATYLNTRFYHFPMLSFDDGGRR